VDSLHRLDDRVFFAINSLAAHTTWLHAPVELYANYGVALFAVLLAVALLRARVRSSRELAATVWAGLGTLLALAVNQPLGHLVHEARPYATHPHVLLLAHRSSDFSFPSDHAVMAGAVAAGLLIAWRRTGVLAVVLAVLMAFARVYIAAHYPWDVVAGLLVGAVVVAVGWLLLRRPLVAVTDALRGVPPFRVAFAARTGPDTRIPATSESRSAA
jgi:undecaprenyl-diphosphatase